MSEKLERINRALSVPETMISSDGREFKVRRWAPIADYQRPGLVQISAELIVKVDGEYAVYDNEAVQEMENDEASQVSQSNAD